MRVLLATGNPAKKKLYVEVIAEFGYEVICLNDIDVELSVDESGNNPLENALIKAKAYYEATGMPTIAQDDGLIIDKFSEVKQPGTHVRRVNGRELTDDEMIEYYSSEIEKVGGKSDGRWVRGLAFIVDDDTVYTLESEDETMFVSEPCEIRQEGYPLSSLAFRKKLNKYTIEMTKEEQEEEWKLYYEKIRKFFKEHKTF